MLPKYIPERVEIYNLKCAVPQILNLIPFQHQDSYLNMKINNLCYISSRNCELNPPGWVHQCKDVVMPLPLAVLFAWCTKVAPSYDVTVNRFGPSAALLLHVTVM